MFSTSALTRSAAALLVATCAVQPAHTSAAQRISSSVRVTPRITPALLVKESLRHTRLSQVEAETRVIGPKAARRADFHLQSTKNTQPVLLNARPGAPIMVGGTATPTIVVSVLSYGLYETDPIAITRQIDYTYNAQNGALVAEKSTVADAATARRFGLSALRRRGAK